jgi:membrane-bound inhibitor of C-type lysozyme
MRPLPVKLPLVMIFLALFLAEGCALSRHGMLSVRGGEPVVYQCEDGKQLIARYYTLSDRSLGFVKLVMPDGREFTLPNVVSASGARYTDDRELVWWIKGDSAFAETRDQNGEWQPLYKDCRVIQKTHAK